MSDKYYEFLFESNGWKVYGIERLDNPAVLHPETFIPMRPLASCMVQKRIGINSEGKIKDYPTVIGKGQQIECFTLDGKDKYTITT